MGVWMLPFASKRFLPTDGASGAAQGGVETVFEGANLPS